MSDLSGCPCDVSGSVCPCDLSGCCDLTDNEATELVASSDAQTLVETTWGLRLRNRIQQLGEEAGNFQILHPIARPPIVVDYKATTEKLNEFYFQTMMVRLRSFLMTAKCLSSSWTAAQKTGKAVRASFQEQQYVFFEGSSFPYKLDELQLESPGVPAVEWYYNATTNTFITARLYANSQHFTKHHIPYLAAQIKYNDLTLYDISEFINSVRWAGEDGETMPNVDHLVSAWTLSSGIVLRRSSTMVLSVINTDGDDVQLPLRNEA